MPHHPHLPRLGIRAVAVYSDADRDALHVARADEAIWIGPAAASESYLRAEAILEAAARAGAQAIHPGYGFLAENAAFARGLRRRGHDLHRAEPRGDRGDGRRRIEAKAADRGGGRAAGAGLPRRAPGRGGLLEAAHELGFPVLLKAAAGGGGKGMRVVARAG